jgi:hypothetical protein
MSRLIDGSEEAHTKEFLQKSEGTRSIDSSSRKSGCRRHDLFTVFGEMA